MNDVIGNGFLALSVCIGREMGLYDEMCSLEAPATVQQIADKTNLKERLVCLNKIHAKLVSPRIFKNAGQWEYI